MTRAQELAAQELEVLVARAARRGSLDPMDLVDTYRAVSPARHALLNDARRVDLNALVDALAWLSPRLFEASDVLLVADLARFGHAPVAGGALPAGVLEDGTLLLEMSLGLTSVVELGAHLCTLHLEREKAEMLRAEAALGSELGTSSAAHLAFAWGVDETALDQAELLSNGALLRHLLRTDELPRLRIHPEVAISALEQRGQDLGARIVGTLAEMGLADRPLHIWVGSPMVTDLVSPYVRELRQVLLDWAAEHSQELGRDLVPLPEDVSEDQLYAIAADFLRSDPRLVTERVAADRSVGIMHYAVDGVPFDIVDMGRIETQVADARLSPFDADGSAPVIVRLTPDGKDPSCATLRIVLASLGPQVHSVTLALDGRLGGERPGTLLLPTHVRRVEGGAVSSLRGLVRLGFEVLQPLTDAPMIAGELLSVGCPRLLPRDNDGAMPHALESGGAKYLTAALDALDARQLADDALVECVVVASSPAGSERPTVATLAGHAAFALARLQQLLPAPAPPTRERRQREGSRSGGGRGVRIRA